MDSCGEPRRPRGLREPAVAARHAVRPRFPLPGARILPGARPGSRGLRAWLLARTQRARRLGADGQRAADRPPARYAWRVFAICLLGAIAVCLTVFQYQFRHLEATVAADVYGVVTPTLAASQAPIVWFGLGTTRAFGLVITPECSSALLIVPLCGLGMLLMVPRRLPVGRVAAAIAVAVVVLVMGNLTRIGVIAIATWAGGVGSGYQLGHLVFGTLVSILFIAVSLMLLTAIITSNHDKLLGYGLLSRYRRGGR